ncbi:MAG: hypothetical protein IPM92_09680 [Saprospiraceae bacterium]|nr:hypothetical protein [Saprospiraceae bacterium]
MKIQRFLRTGVYHLRSDAIGGHELSDLNSAMSSTEQLLINGKDSKQIFIGK